MPVEIDEKDWTRLRHMLDAAREALAFARGRTRADLDDDPMFRRAVLHCIQEVGEAASRVTPETRALIPDLPWPDVVRMRNRLVHAYFVVDHDIVWRVLTTELEPLVRSFTELLEPPEQR